MKGKWSRGWRCSVANSWWSNWIAIEPSPTADATRLTEPWRTSPAANTPGMLVSRRNGRAVERPDRRRRQVGAGEDEALLVPLDLGGQPLGVRAGADHEEQRVGRRRSRSCAVGAVAQHEVLEPAVAAAADDLGAEPHLDVVGVASTWRTR